MPFRKEYILQLSHFSCFFPSRAGGPVAYRVTGHSSDGIHMPTVGLPVQSHQLGCRLVGLALGTRA
eukprot:4250955-Amphidinium_carterae.1